MVGTQVDERPGEIRLSQWIVAVTESRSEHRAAEHVKRQGLETYIPKLRESIIVEGRRVWKLSVMFPRYLFILVEGPWRFLLSTFGIINIVMRGGGEEPAELNHQVIQTLRSQEKSDGYILLPTEPQFRKGQRVLLKHGCMAGQLGIYQGASSLERELVLMSILGKDTPVSVTSGCLASV